MLLLKRDPRKNFREPLFFARGRVPRTGKNILFKQLNNVPLFYLQFIHIAVGEYIPKMIYKKPKQSWTVIGTFPTHLIPLLAISLFIRAYSLER